MLKSLSFATMRTPVVADSIDRCPCRRGQARPPPVAKKPAHSENQLGGIAETPIQAPIATTPSLLHIEGVADTPTASEGVWIPTKSAWSGAMRYDAKRAWSNRSDGEKTMSTRIITTVSDRIICRLCPPPLEMIRY